MTNPDISAAAFKEFVRRVRQATTTIEDEHELTTTVSQSLRELLDSGYSPADESKKPNADHYVMYPLYVAPDASFSVASAVWDVGQRTPVHGHETWGVVGIQSGVETETRYAKPTEANVPLTSLPEHSWGPGEVTICCTTDDDIHQVSCGSDVPCVGIHVYGDDIGRLNRRGYNPSTGEVNWFISSWASDRSH